MCYCTMRLFQKSHYIKEIKEEDQKLDLNDHLNLEDTLNITYSTYYME